MKRLKFSAILILILALAAIVHAQQTFYFSLFVSCVSADGIFFGYESEVPLRLQSSVVIQGVGEQIGAAPANFAAGRRENVFGVKLDPDAIAYWSVDGNSWGQTIFIDGRTTGPSCPEDSGTGRPDGGIVVITAYVAGVPGVDRCTWEIRNHGDPDVWDDIDGSTGVEIDPETDIIFCRLPLGADNLDHEPANYRATVVGGNADSP